MIKKNINSKEFDNFTNLALEWWKPDGKFKIIHEILPLRMKYIINNLDVNHIKNLKILDLGCGGGLTCEPLARLGADVTGIDFIKKNIQVAKEHSFKSCLKIKYVKQDLMNINFKTNYDVVLMLEIIEHITNWKELIEKVSKILKPNGKIIISTINKNYLSKIFAIKIAENILKWVPKNTHTYEKFIKPNEIKSIMKKNNLFLEDITGLNYNPVIREWKLNSNLYPINYFCTLKKIN